MHRKSLTHRPIDPEIQQLVQDFAGPEALLDVLQVLHQRRGNLEKHTLTDVARAFRIPPERAFGVATFYSLLVSPPETIRICDGPSCWLNGAAYARAAVENSLHGSSTKVERSSCLGMCDRAPAALVGTEQCGPLDPLQPEIILQGWRGEMPSYSIPRPGELRMLMANADQVDPHSIDTALACGAYQGLAKALMQTPDWVIGQVQTADLRGRGGAGFPTGRKLHAVASAPGEEKYVVCNADESEPLAFKDRVLIDSHPQKVLEGMAIAGYAVGSKEAYIYIRGEYSAQADLLEKAVRQAEEKGWLGDHIQGSEFSFKIHVHRGAGAYICGEESALLESLEGRRGEPRIRPPFPATHGLRGKPTNVNNVETFAVIASILQLGVEDYLKIGNPQVPGTKLYTLLGHVNQPGFFEAPYGLTLRQVIEEFGGGMQPGSEFQFALTGGAAGTLVPPSLLDIPIDYNSTAKGVSLGAGAFLICDQTVSPVMLLRELMFFFEVESCGKCTPCRVGTHEVRHLLDRLIGGRAPQDVQEKLLDLAELLQKTSFCGLGQSCAMPIKSTLTHFASSF